MWFTENPWPGIVLFVGLSCFFLMRALKQGLVRDYGLCGLMLLGALAVYVIEQAIVTPAEEIRGHLAELLDDCKRNDVEAVVGRISKNNPVLRTLVTTGLNMAKIHDDVRLTDIQVQTLAENTRGVSHFRANGTITAHSVSYANRVSTRWEMTWQKEGGEWRIVSIKRLNPITGEDMDMLKQAEM